MNSVLSLIGLALRAGRLEAGEDPAGDACRARRCRLLLTASDAGESALRRAARFAREGECLILALPFTREELGRALGRGSCAMAAVTDLGLARAIAERLEAQDPDRYGEAVRRLRLKAERAAQRRERSGKKRQDGRSRAPVKDRNKP